MEDGSNFRAELDSLTYNLITLRDSLSQLHTAVVTHKDNNNKIDVAVMETQV